MKKTLSQSPPLSVPRLDSLLHRLQHAKGAKEECYLDQLMIFLENPPAGVHDRWKEGAKMCEEWGVPCSHTSVWRLYRSHVLEWRSRLVEEAETVENEKPEILAQKIERMVARRTLEILSNPQAAPQAIVSLARVSVHKQVLEFARKRHEDHETKEVDKAIKGLSLRVMFNREASYLLGKLKENLAKPPLTVEQFIDQHGLNPITGKLKKPF